MREIREVATVEVLEPWEGWNKAREYPSMERARRYAYLLWRWRGETTRVVMVIEEHWYTGG